MTYQRNGLYFIILFITLLINYQNVSAQDEKKPVLFSDVIGRNSGLRLSNFNGTWNSDNTFIYTQNNTIKEYNVALNEETDILPISAFTSFPNDRVFYYSYDSTQLLIRYNRISIFRHSNRASYVIYNIATLNTTTNISNTESINYCMWSPVNLNVVYVKENDVYYLEEDGTETRLTFDGVDGVIYNGIPDWVYEEEILGSGAAMWFSPDGNWLAVASFDDTNVTEFSYILYGEAGDMNYQYEREVHLRYPKPGSVNPLVKLTVYNLQTTEFENVTIPVPVNLTDVDHILGSVNWLNNNQIISVWLNRRQNEQYVSICDVTSTLENRCIVRYENVLEKGWFDSSAPYCLNDLSKCYFNGFDEMFNVTISNIYNYNENTDELLYLGVPLSNPEQRHVYRNEECLSCNVTGPEGELCTYAAASFSNEFTYYALICGGPTPSYTKLFRLNDTAELLTWEVNAESREKLYTFQRPNIKYERVDVANGFQAAVKLILPPEIDINAATFTTKYPMIVYVYGGPNSARVTDSFSFDFADYLTTTRKVIYCQIDGRGSGNKGNDMLFEIDLKMGTVEIEDQMEVTKYLRDKYDFIDSERIGIWGWSYGGYATAMVLAKDNDRIFQCGISVAPVTAWIYYDSMYTERYMDTPENNPLGYNNSDVTRIVDNFKTHDFLLIHGSADDNVHFQQSMALSRALQLENIMFEQMNYPNEAHSLGGVTSHVYLTMDEFWVDCLNLEIDEEQ